MPEIKECPVCAKRVVINLTIDFGKEKAVWYQCQCGCLFKAKYESKFDEQYKKDYQMGRGIKECLDYQRRVYMPLIGELTTGRVILDVGPTLPLNIESWRADGWIAEGIDLIKDDNPHIIQGDFENYKFKKKYDVIWMADVVQSFQDPVRALVKAHFLLKPNGVLFVSTPAPNLIHELGYRGWPCWDNKLDNVYLTGDNLVKILANMGMDIVLKWENYQPRFGESMNTHIIAQRVYGLTEGSENGKKNDTSNLKSGT
jgi:SAM-dependent methyltransferase